MAQIPKIPASAYTPEMETFGAIPDIRVFEGTRILMSRNALTHGMRPLQFPPAPGSNFSVRHETDVMRGFQSKLHDAAVLWKNSCVTQLLAAQRSSLASYVTRLHGCVDLSKARAGKSSTDASGFWNLLDPPMQARVIAAGFGDYTLGLHRTQPRFPPAMRYALMEQWNDCTHSFIIGFGELTLTPADYTAIIRLGFNGDAVPLDARYQTAALGAELVATLLGVTTRTRYTAQGYVSYEVVYKFWAERIRTRLAAWRDLPADARPAAPAYT
ncbi:hypothetical protein JCGZ_08310 [Jatropha curcas]|uniref:Aminotransferase-like plant mobile domain-containing protein n=1 Tax=Jatropha curcas TaxID=180498 RepID=A0A067KNF1_JATCU|nr:hypothetical protein JCGZ_08310 [Jatropha curcas]